MSPSILNAMGNQRKVFSGEITLHAIYIKRIYWKKKIKNVHFHIYYHTNTFDDFVTFAVVVYSLESHRFYVSDSGGVSG